MDWTAIGALGELIGAVAVVASLIYVGRQVRIAAKAAGIEGVEALQRQTADFAFTVAADSDLAELVVRVQTQGARREELSVAERGRIGYLYFALVSIQNALWERERAGLMSRELRDAQIQRNAALMVAPYFQDVWPFMSASFSPEYRAFIEATYLKTRLEAPDPYSTA